MEWEFRIDRGRGAGDWSRIAVPSNWELEGFGGYAYGMDDPRKADHAEWGEYRHEFRVPETWRGRRVRLVFEGAMTDTRVRVNGFRAGPIHRGGFTRFGYEVTELLEYGAGNVLEVEVSESSWNGSVEQAEREADYWVFGGIYRPVYLEAAPVRSISHVAIDARHDGGLLVSVELAGVRGGETVETRVLDSEGRPVGGAPVTGSVGPGLERVILEGEVGDVSSWSAERPHLYRLELLLHDRGKALHQTWREFGFRTVELRPGKGLFVNGRRTLLKGVNRHSFWPESGRSLSRELNRRDAELIKTLNANAVRTSHYPPDADFLDACDELGIYVIDELPGWHDAYRARAGNRVVGEMVRRDVNHPSVILWANGNEGGWNSLIESRFAHHDPQERPVLHPGGYASGVDATHYPTYSELENLLAGGSFMDRVRRLGDGPPLVLPTEMLHGLYDGGGGASLEAYWLLLSGSERGIGGFLWSLVDEGVARSDRGGQIDVRGNYGPDGIVGPYRKPEASFDAIREIWSPVRLESADWASGAVKLGNDYLETDLSELTLRWQALVFPAAGDLPLERVVFEEELAGPATAPGETGEVAMRARPDVRYDALRLTAIDSAGREVARWTGWVVEPNELAERVIDLAAGTDPPGGSLPEWLTGPRALGSTSLSTAVSARPSGWVRVAVDHADPLGFTLDLPGFDPAGLVWLGGGPWPVWDNRLAGSDLGVWSRPIRKHPARWPGGMGFYKDVQWLRLAAAGGFVTVIVEPRDLYVAVLAPRFHDDAQNARAELPELGDLSFVRRIPAIGTKFHPPSSLGPPLEPTVASSRTDVVWLRFDPRE